MSSYKDYASNVFIKKIGIVFIIAIDLWSLCAQIMGGVRHPRWFRLSV